MESLFEKYGGFAKVSKIVPELYNRVLDDDDLGPFFDDVDMTRVMDHQTKFISSLMGGPVTYSDEQIQRMHKHLAISGSHFERLKEILSETLTDHGLSNEGADKIVAHFEQRRAMVVD